MASSACSSAHKRNQVAVYFGYMTGKYILVVHQHRAITHAVKFLVDAGL